MKLIPISRYREKLKKMSDEGIEAELTRTKRLKNQPMYHNAALNELTRRKENGN